MRGHEALRAAEVTVLDKPMMSRWLAPALACLAVSVLAGCTSEKGQGAGSSSAPGRDGTVALLLKENKTTRWEAFDRPYFTEKWKSLCPGCKLIYSNAEQDSAKQQAQAEAALTNGAKVLVITPVDSEAAVAIVARAKAQKVPVIAYDALIMNADIDYFVSFQNEKVGELQGQALLKKLTADGTADKGKVVWINGSPTDNNARQFKKGAHTALDGKVSVGREYDTPDWSPDKAQQEMEQAITALGKDNIVGVYAANDGTAGGAIAAMKSAGFATLPPVTGQDAELAAIQRIISGEQYMTVYKAIKPEAEAAAELAYALLKGERPSVPDVVNNGQKDVPARLLTSIAVTRDNIMDTVVKDGFYKLSDICAAQYASACAAAHLQ
ncbi:sugar ABC transporter substrate-binding protein [Archangium sp.]|uniref:sugar ABC transporter substrate-binding protein n=1 Tax=Archangium sp. TaxID=1872627 RepID=UPI002D46C4C3|nr:sugar ABC transporter substrate-binding protein [Archangium sp.]HYO56176.1 sugar ABC transporter substrate-binding protein [Archangium sp.]